MDKVKVVFFDVKEHEKEYIERNKPENCEFVLLPDNFHCDLEKDLQVAGDADIISVFTTSRVRKDFLKEFKNLKLISTRSTGYSHIDTNYCKERNIPVVNVPRYGDSTVAEFAFGLLLEIARNISTAYNDLRRGVISPQSYIGIDLFEKTIGIIGTGAIGTHAAKIAKGFGMNILAYDPYPKKELEQSIGLKYVTLDELYEKADIITLHAPATKENFHMINEAAFNKMKNGVIIINTARGEIIDTEALYKALKSGKVAGAGLDVLECEEILGNEDQYIPKIDCIDPQCLTKTLINHRMLDMPNVVITPHVAYDSHEALQRILDTTFNNIKAFLNNEVINRVN